MYEVTILPILLAALVHVVLGMFWYHPRVFGGAWMKMTNLTPDMVEAGKRYMALRVLGGFLTASIAAYVLNYYGIAWGVIDWAGAVELGIWSWVGFVAPVMFGIVLWEQKPFMLFVLNAVYWLVSLILMALVLVA